MKERIEKDTLGEVRVPADLRVGMAFSMEENRDRPEKWVRITKIHSLDVKVHLEWDNPDWSTNFRFSSLHNYCVLVDYKPGADLSRYPHKCPRCGEPAYVGAVVASVDCTNLECATKRR